MTDKKNTPLDEEKETFEKEIRQKYGAKNNVEELLAALLASNLRVEEKLNVLIEGNKPAKREQKKREKTKREKKKKKK